MTPFIHIYHQAKSWLRDGDGIAATETALLMPIMALMLLGAFDVGRGLLVSQKVITASQVGVDLIARNMSVTDDAINESVEAARLVMAPYDTQDFGIDIVSLQFDDDSQPEIVWRETRNMTPNTAAVSSTAGIFDAGEGVVIVTVGYKYSPAFSDFVIGDIGMQEVAFARGRRSAVVVRD